MKNKKMIFSILFVIIGILILVTPNHLAPVCGPKPDGHFMKCHWMGQALIGQGIFIVITGIIFGLVKNESINLGISISNIIVGIITILLPLYLIGGCKMPTMSCNTHTKPTVLVLAAVYIIANIVYLFVGTKKKS
ncbi:MAG: DUF4418 family protein [Tissierellia bacterium]|nr:DUF4418 family protein [Tissierellia bacterium]